MLKVLIADSNELIRIGLHAVLSHQTGMEVVGAAANRSQLMDNIARYMPDVVVIDYSSKEFSLDTILEITQYNNTIKFVAITDNHSAVGIINAIKSGIWSHVKKDCDVGEIIDSVRETAKGNRFFCGSLLEMIKKESINVDEIENIELNCMPVSLSDRELEIITYIAEGYTNQQIAEKLFLSAHTVNTHRKNIMAKLGINNTAGIVMYAVKANLVSPNKFLFSPQ